MTRYAFLGLFLVGLAAIVYVLISASSGNTGSNRLERYATGEMQALSFASMGQPAPGGTFIDADGELRGLDSLRGRTILVNYWATWCGPCEKEMPALGALQTARGGDAFEVVALSVDARDEGDYARRRLAELGAANIRFRHAPLDQGEVVYGAGVRGFPTTILYGPDGLEIARLEGDADWASLEAVQFIDAALRLAGER
ncbi:TlpA family protein disulfide reductase [Hyphomonas sp.]|uniref:TlpA family protein disulfide reductase n=1 Tax=Hyphomonas sp. TaxID=87 RepID=UPI00391DC557